MWPRHTSIVSFGHLSVLISWSPEVHMSFSIRLLSAGLLAAMLLPAQNNNSSSFSPRWWAKYQYLLQNGARLGWGRAACFLHGGGRGRHCAGHSPHPVRRGAHGRRSTWQLVARAAGWCIYGAQAEHLA
jgi:hypothetical protein